MQQVFDRIEFIAGNADILDKMPEQSACRVFDEQITGFLSTLSGVLLRLPQAKAFPDVVTFAFWLRKANLAALAKPYEGENRLGRGIVFHIAPSNVPVNFAYSLVAGMLAGNANIVRVPSKNFEQVKIIVDAINDIMYEFPQIAERLCLVRYGHDKEVNDYLSSICTSRVIWGGDETVNEIRKSHIPSRTNEITFPDRYSICLIHADKYLAEYDAEKTGQDFFNDTYLTDQNACTSPRVLIWFGDNILEAKERFWGALTANIRNKYDIQPVQVVNKLTDFYEYAASNKGRLTVTGDYRIVRIEIDHIPVDLPNHFGNSGFFYEYRMEALDDIVSLCGRKCQTLSHIGFDADELRQYVLEKGLFGIDRIVPMGKTMDFILTWDGIDLIRTLTREICI